MVAAVAAHLFIPFKILHELNMLATRAFKHHIRRDMDIIRGRRLFDVGLHPFFYLLKQILHQGDQLPFSEVLPALLQGI